MQLILQVTQELAAELERIAKENLVSVEDVSTAVLSGYVVRETRKKPSSNLPTILKGFGTALTQAAEVLEQQAKKQE